MAVGGTFTGRRGGLALVALAAVVVGVVLVVFALLHQESAPQAPRSVGTTDPSTSSAEPSADAGAQSPSSAGSPVKQEKQKQPLGASKPVRITIPKIGVNSSVLPIGLASDGSLAVPQPGPDLDKAAWFKNSPTPGQPGPSIIEGHVDSEKGPSVFFKLGQLRPGNKILVNRADGARLTFTVSGIRDYKKAAFPTTVVYGAKNLSRPQLRLITCSDFDQSIRHHVGNTVVFAQLTKVIR